ncbi:MAG: hypothetical protein LBL23_04575 [Coriobacteriales bacterium]|jgi:hypothetical protein|nr:hypothetical protein [Coriobacteriales bacterium]
MSGYVPRHAREKTDSALPAEADLSRAEEDRADSEEPLSSSDEPPSSSDTAPSLPDTTSPDAEVSALSAEVLLEAIVDADKAVHEHPELADPLIEPDEPLEQAELLRMGDAVLVGVVPEVEADTALARIRKRRWPVTIAILLILIVGSGAITYAVLSSQALEREARRTAGYELLDEAIALIQESDQVVVSLDTATTTEVTESNLSEREVLLKRVPTTQETLSSAEEKALSAVELLTATDDREFAQHVIDAAVNRQVLLTSGEAIIGKDIEAMNSALIFGQAWEVIVNADTELRATTQLSKTGSYNELQEAIERNNTVLTRLQQAQTLLAQAQEAFEDADYSVVTEYVALKIASVHLAIEADQALFDGDIELVNTKNTEFTLRDAAVVNAAGKIPSDPLTMITLAYEAATAENYALYDSARANAAEADGYIREYVGVETQTGVQ